MNARRRFLVTLGTGLLTAKTLWAMPAGTPSASDAVEIVEQYLVFRATNEWSKAYALLSSDTQKMIPFAQFAKTNQFPNGPTKGGMTPILTTVSVMFLNAGNTMGYKFQTVGLAPEDPHTVLVSARLRTTSLTDDTKPVMLRVVTAPDSNANYAPRIQMLATYERSAPVEFRQIREVARQTASLSNLKQISLAMLLYTNDHRDTFPHAETWADAIQPYLVKGITSPTEKERFIASLFRDQSAPAWQKWCYAFNSNLSGRSVLKIDNPAAIILIFNTESDRKNASDPGTSIPQPGWHRHGSVYAQADGHCLWHSDKDTLSFSLDGQPSP